LKLQILSFILKHQSPMAENLLKFNSNNSVPSTGQCYRRDTEYNDCIIKTRSVRSMTDKVNDHGFNTSFWSRNNENIVFKSYQRLV